MASILSVNKVRGRYVIDLGDEKLTVSSALFRERPLREGDELDMEEYEQWLLLHQYRPALDEAVAMLAQRPQATG